MSAKKKLTIYMPPRRPEWRKLTATLWELHGTPVLVVRTGPWPDDGFRFYAIREGKDSARIQRFTGRGALSRAKKQGEEWA